jgi:hypothetical protein
VTTQEMASFSHAVRVNDTLDAMMDDARLLATNLVPISFYLNQFYITLLNTESFKLQVEESVCKVSPEVKQGDDKVVYQAMSRVFADMILHPLDLGDELVASDCAEYMEMYFNGIPLHRVMWFTPTVVAD